MLKKFFNTGIKYNENKKEFIIPLKDSSLKDLLVILLEGNDNAYFRGKKLILEVSDDLKAGDLLKLFKSAGIKFK